MTRKETPKKAQTAPARPAIDPQPEPQQQGGLPAFVWAGLIGLSVLGFVLWQMQGR